jgi:hypothetical protein
MIWWFVLAACVLMLVVTIVDKAREKRRASDSTTAIHSPRDLVGGTRIQFTVSNGAGDIKVAKVRADVPVSPLDLRVPVGTSCAVAGLSHWIDPEEKSRIGNVRFFLRREHANKHDSNAVAVYAGRRKIGYLSAAMAARYAPLLDAFDAEAFVVNRDLSRKRFSFLMPRVAEMRKRLQRD